MEYISKETKKYNFYNIKTDKFAVSQILVRYSIPFDKKKITLLNVFSKYMGRANKKYKTIKEVYKETEKRFLLDLGYGRGIRSSLLTLECFAKFPDINHLGIEKIESIFDFLFDLSFDIDFEENENNISQLKIVKDQILKSILKEKENKSSYASQRFHNIFFEGTPYEYNMDGYEEDLNSIDIKSLATLAEELFSTAQVDIFVISSMDLNDVIYDRFIERENKKYDNSFVIAKDYNQKEIKEQIEANQSILKMAYTYDSLSDYEVNAVVPMFLEIFGGGGGSVLFQEVREKHSLCYHISARGKKYNKYILINSGISASNYEKTKELVMQELEKVKENNISEVILEGARMTLINDQLAKTDSKSALLSEYENKIYYNEILKEDKIEMLKKVTKEDIAAFASKLKLSFTYLLEGVESIEKN